MLSCHIRRCFAVRGGSDMHVPHKTTAVATVHRSADALCSPPSVASSAAEATLRAQPPRTASHAVCGEIRHIDAHVTIRRPRAVAAHPHARPSSAAVCVPASPLTRAGGVGYPTGLRLAPAVPRVPYANADTSPQGTAERHSPTTPEPTAAHSGSRGVTGGTDRTRSAHEDLFVVTNARHALESLLGTAGSVRPAATPPPATASGPAPSTRRTRRHPTRTQVGERSADEQTVALATPAKEADALDSVAAADMEAARDEEEVVTHASDPWELNHATATPAPHVDTAPPLLFGSTPCSVGGVPYPAAVADTLAKAGASCRFRSPVWATPAQFAAIGFHLRPDVATHTETGAAGVTLPLVNSSVVFYNLEQTTGAATTPAELVTLCRSCGIQVASRHAQTSAQRAYREKNTYTSREAFLASKPRDLRGLSWYGNAFSSIRASPHFSTLQEASPFWLTLSQIVAISAQVRDEERGRAVVLAPSSPSQSAFESGEPRSEPIMMIPDAFKTVHAAHAHATHADLNATLVYNCSQLTAPERFTPAACGLHAGCYNRSGRRYGAAMSFLLLEYCHTHQFTTQDPLEETIPHHTGDGTTAEPMSADAHVGKWKIVFCSETHVRRLGGVIMPWPRGASAEQQAPPFTALTADGSLLVLYNAEQTSVYHEVKRHAEEKMAERKDYFRARRASS